MMGSTELQLAGAPRLVLLDATDRGLDPDALRRWARARTSQLPASCTARSYSFPYALLGWHAGPLGVDLERITAPDRAFADSIRTPAERQELEVGEISGRALASLWCSKEALAKALGDALRYDPRRLDSPAGWAGGQSGPWRASELEAPAGHVAWVVWHATDGQPVADRAACATWPRRSSPALSASAEIRRRAGAS